jgi:hypothetical protein
VSRVTLAQGKELFARSLARPTLLGRADEVIE